MKNIIIAIDGPSGAGKSTVARLLAKKYDFEYVDTGAMYRAMALKFIRAHANVQDEESLAFLLQGTSVTFNNNVIMLDGKAVGDDIRTPEVDAFVAKIAEIRAVREKLVLEQKKMGESKSIVMDGRDIGTNVFPNADFKFFVTASAEERAKRRYHELITRGYDVDYFTIKKEIEDRDYVDTHRSINPLVQADDARIIDTTEKTIAEAVASLERFIKF